MLESNSGHIGGFRALSPLWLPGSIVGGRGNWEVGEERMGSGRSKRVASRREMQNTNFFNSTMNYNTFKNKNPKYI